MGTGGRRGGYPSRGQTDGALGLGPSVWAAGYYASPWGQEYRLGLPQAIAGPEGSGGQGVHLALRRLARGLKLLPAAASAVATNRRRVVQGDVYKQTCKNRIKLTLTPPARLL